LVADITFTRATLADAAELAGCLRAADIAELAAAGLTSEALAFSVEASTWAVTVRVDGAMGCVFGVAPLGGTFFSDTGVPWMLGSDLVRKHQRLLMRGSAPYIRLMLKDYGHLLNFVHAENKEAVRWLKHMGFTLHPEAPHGPHGAPFHKFEMHHV
jgi:Protein of unknown function (DUF2833)